MMDINIKLWQAIFQWVGMKWKWKTTISIQLPSLSWIITICIKIYFGISQNHATCLFANFFHLFHYEFNLVSWLFLIQTLKWTLYHTIQTFNDPEKETFWKHCGKRRKCWHFLLFLQCFLPFPKQNSIFQPNLIGRLQMLSIWTSPKIYSFGKGLIKVKDVTKGYSNLFSENHDLHSKSQSSKGQNRLID